MEVTQSSILEVERLARRTSGAQGQSPSGTGEEEDLDFAALLAASVEQEAQSGTIRALAIFQVPQSNPDDEVLNQHPEVQEHDADRGRSLRFREDEDDDSDDDDQSAASVAAGLAAVVDGQLDRASQVAPVERAATDARVPQAASAQRNPAELRPQVREAGAVQVLPDDETPEASRLRANVNGRQDVDSRPSTFRSAVTASEAQSHAKSGGTSATAKDLALVEILRDARLGLEGGRKVDTTNPQQAANAQQQQGQALPAGASDPSQLVSAQNAQVAVASRAQTVSANGAGADDAHQQLARQFAAPNTAKAASDKSDAQAQAASATGADRSEFRNLVTKSGQTAGNRGLTPQQQATLDQVHVNIQRLLNSRDRIDIRLRPPNLGGVQVQVDLAKDGNTVTVFADRPDTLNLLRSDARGLLSSLGDAGIQLDAGNLNFLLSGQGESFASQKRDGGVKEELATVSTRGEDQGDGALEAGAEISLDDEGHLDVSL